MNKKQREQLIRVTKALANAKDTDKILKSFKMPPELTSILGSLYLHIMLYNLKHFKPNVNFKDWLAEYKRKKNE